MIINPQLLRFQGERLLQQQRHTLTLGTTATPFGCCNFFDRCTDELMGLHFAGGLPLLDWMGFDVTDVCVVVNEFITFLRPAYSGGNPTAGHLANPCTDPNGFEFGTAKFTIDWFGRYGRSGPTRDLMRPERYCVTDPRRRLDGTVVTDEREWDLRFTMETIIQDISRHLITGNHATPGMMDGLEQIVTTGYASSMLDSWVVDWGGNPMAGGAGITINGQAIAATFDFIEVLQALIRRIKQRIGWSAVLSNQQMNLGDMILVMPSHVAECLLDFYTCWNQCPTDGNYAVFITSPEAREYRTQLMGGLFGYGQITIDGVPIPILGYDWELIKTPTLSDIYLLTGGVGSVRLWYGQHLSAAAAAARYGGRGYFSTDGGRVLGLTDTSNECDVLKAWIHPRIWTRAPWAQIRFQNVQCDGVLDPLSPDPLQTSFYPLTSFTPAVCP
jgi:hypothetical protein